jgi:hypothetical protein
VVIFTRMIFFFFSSLANILINKPHADGTIHNNGAC